MWGVRVGTLVLMPRTLPDISVPDLTGRLALVTGASDGLGLVLAERLARAGAELILPVRNQGKGQAAAQRIRAAAPAATSLRLRDLVADLVLLVAGQHVVALAGVAAH